MQGGVITTNSDVIAKILLQKSSELKCHGITGTFISILKSSLYSVFMYPRFYWIPQHLNFLKLGDTVFNLNFKIKQIDSFTCALGIVMLEQIAKITLVRTEKGDLIFQKLSRFRNYLLMNSLNSSYLLRFPLLMKNKEQKESLLSELKLCGIGATGMYPAPLNFFKDTKKYFNGDDQYKNAQSFSERILTLPLHDFVTEKDVDKIRDVMEKISRKDE
jgi:dTDP-4-amino-4,6-dideoxygalactose transaminase